MFSPAVTRTLRYLAGIDDGAQFLDPNAEASAPGATATGGSGGVPPAAAAPSSADWDAAQQPTAGAGTSWAPPAEPQYDPRQYDEGQRETGPAPWTPTSPEGTPAAATTTQPAPPQYTYEIADGRTAPPTPNGDWRPMEVRPRPAPVADQGLPNPYGAPRSPAADLNPGAPADYGDGGQARRAAQQPEISASRPVQSTYGEPDYVDRRSDAERLLTTPVAMPARRELAPYDPERAARDPGYNASRSRTQDDVAAIPYQALEAIRQSVLDVVNNAEDTGTAWGEQRKVAALGNALLGVANTLGLPYNVVARTVNQMFPEMTIAGVGVGDVLSLYHDAFRLGAGATGVVQSAWQGKPVAAFERGVEMLGRGQEIADNAIEAARPVVGAAVQGVKRAGRAMGEEIAGQLLDLPTVPRMAQAGEGGLSTAAKRLTADEAGSVVDYLAIRHDALNGSNAADQLVGKTPEEIRQTLQQWHAQGVFPEVKDARAFDEEIMSALSAAERDAQGRRVDPAMERAGYGQRATGDYADASPMSGTASENRRFGDDGYTNRLDPGTTPPPEIPRTVDDAPRDNSFSANATPGISRSAGLIGDAANSIGGGVMGAATGAALPADSEEQRRQNALTGAGIGMIAGPAAGRLLPRGDGALAMPGIGPNGRRAGQTPGAGRPINASDAAEVKRIRLDKFPEEVRPLIEAGAREQDWARTQRRGVISDEAVQSLAADDARSVDQLIKSGKAGKAYNAEETVALRNAVASQADVVRQLSQEIADARANGVTPDLLIARRAAEAARLNGLVNLAEGARAEAGRALRQYRQQARLIEMNPNQAVQQIYKRLGGRDNAEAAVDEYTKLVNDGANPIQLAKFWSKIENGKITAPELFALYRRFNMLSGPRTLEVNALSGAVNLGYEVVNQALGQVARARIPEAAAEIAAPLKAMNRAFKNMAETMYHGVSMEQAARGDIPRNLSQRTENPAARGALTVLELPDRFNAGVDQFFRTMTEDWAATMLAHRQARQAGMTPRSQGWAETVAKNLEAIREDPSKFPEIKAMADRVTFSEEPGAVGKGLEAFRQQAPVIANILMPFIRTPYNIASRAIDMSPLGIVRTGIETGTGMGRGTENISARLRDNAIGVGASVWAYQQAQHGNLTGAGPDDPEKLAELRATGWQPYSVKIGDQYWSYGNFAPFSFALAAGAAAAEAQKYAKDGKTDTLSMLADGAGRTAKVVTEMTVLAGIGAVIKSIEDPDRYGGRWLSQFLQTLIPAGSALNTAGQMMDPYMRRAERDTFANQVKGDLLSRIPPNPFTPDRMDVPAAQDPLGRPVPNEQVGAGALNPFRPTTERADPALQPFIDSGVDIGKPKENLTLRPGAPPIPLTPAEQRRWNELRGEQLQQVAPQVARAASYQQAGRAGQETVLKRLLSNAGNAADGRLAQEIGDAEIRRRLTEALQKKAS